MRAKCLLLCAVPMLFLAGCATSGRSPAETGRYQTIIGDGMAVMTDTVTGQAWATPVGQSLGFSKDFAKPKRD